MHHDGLKDKHRADPRVERVVLYGSRATGRHRPASDIDVMLVGAELDDHALLDIEERIAELPYPHKVDLHLFHELSSPRLLGFIRRDGVEWYRRPAGSRVAA